MVRLRRLQNRAIELDVLLRGRLKRGGRRPRGRASLVFGSTVIEARERPMATVVPTPETVPSPPKRRGRPKKGEERPKEPTRIERQLNMATLRVRRLASHPTSRLFTDSP